MLYILYFSCLSLEKDYFPYKLFNKLFFLPQSTCQFSLSVIKINYNMRMYVMFIFLYTFYMHAHNYRFFWEGLYFN